MKRYEMVRYEIEYKIRSLRLYLENIVDNEKAETWEDKRTKSSIYELVRELDKYERIMKYYSKEPRTGKLTLNDRGRYEINGIELTCGHGLELFMFSSDECCETWCEGCVEADNGRYYFFNSEGKNKYLEEGDLARVRI